MALRPAYTKVTSLVSIIVMLFILLIAIDTIPNGLWVIVLIILIPFILLNLYYLISSIEGSSVVKRFLNEIQKIDFNNFPLPYEASIYDYSIVDIKYYGSRGGSYIGTDSFSGPRLGKIQGTVNLAEIVSDNLLIRENDTQGEFKGKVIKFDDGKYKGVMIIPLYTNLRDMRISETLGDEHDSAIFDIEISSCKITGNITVLARNKARSYRVELVGRLEHIEVKKIIYKGDQGSFSFDLSPCKPLLAIIDEHNLSVNNIVSELEKNNGNFDSEIIIGYRNGALSLKFVIDRPISKDLIKEVPI
ncbi:MAG TPA: hypothetical protein VKU94_06030 [Geobacterales bacterium]|nr:hypothetical protein [Geobacterales bacterium]